MNPFCHLVIKAIRYDSNPPVGKALNCLLNQDVTVKMLADQLGVSAKTIQNWNIGRTKPARALWPKIRSLVVSK